MSNLATYPDLVEHLVDYLGGSGPGEAVIRDCKRAILEAYREVPSRHQWTYLYRLGRIHVVPPYSDGTAEFDLSGGAYERLVTLSGGTWPSWAANGWVRLGEVSHRVVARKSDTQIVLAEDSCPSADEADQAYTLYRDGYDLPEDFVASDETTKESFGYGRYVHPREWARLHGDQGPCAPRSYTITASDATPGRLSIRFLPYPDAAQTIEYHYKRLPRPLSIYAEAGGTVTATSGSASVVGSGTAFTSSLVGSCFRLYSTAAPGGSPIGANPPAFETTVLSVESATALTLREPSTKSGVGLGYRISDYVDFEPGAMMNVMYRAAEWHISVNRTLKDKPNAKSQYSDATMAAKDADSRSIGRRAAGRWHPRSLGLHKAAEGTPLTDQE